LPFFITLLGMTRSAVVPSILEATPEAAAEALAGAPREAALVELRADHLRAADVGALVARFGRRTIVTVREAADGGSFAGSAGDKRAILEAALAAGAAYVDVEYGGPCGAMAEGPASARVILSHHGAACEAATLTALFDAMASSRAARLKIVPRADRPAAIGAIRELLLRAARADRPLAAFASGPAGAPTRVFAPSWGSWGTYGAAVPGRETAEGQLSARALIALFRVDAIGPATRRFALFGTPVTGSPSPAVHAAGYAAIGLDAVYVPVETGDPSEISPVAEALGLRGFAATIPLKEEVAKRCARLDRFAACGSANTVVIESGSWDGFNTDAPAALDRIRPHLDLRGATVAIAGAGGTARAIGAALVAEGAVVTLYGRDLVRTEAAAVAIGASSRGLTALPEARWDLLVQATPRGARGETVLDPASLRGKIVLDAAYRPEGTPLARAARGRGLAVVDGYDLLLAQAILQFERLTGERAPGEAMAAAFPQRGGGEQA
jgi:3-dehydroquinate dehydratase/shikimate dehydrogenase